MSGEFCLDCGMLLSTKTSICPVCGFDNSLDTLTDNEPENRFSIPPEKRITPNHRPGR